MKTMINMTTSDDDLNRLQNPEDLEALLAGFDGVELMACGEDPEGKIPADRVVGLHMNCIPCWLDLWNQNEEALLAEFGSEEAIRAYYGGATPETLVRHYRAELAIAKKYRAEYVVFHVAHATIEESFTHRYRHSDEEVIDASCALLNRVFEGEADGPALLLENLWSTGLTMTRPEMTKRLLEGVGWPNKGIMLDTGHLMHTTTALRTQSQALALLHRALDSHGPLCGAVRGVHLHQSLTGGYHQSVINAPPALAKNYSQRYGQLFTHIFKLDRHRPFTCAGVGALVERIAPAYLTFEFITKNNRQLGQFCEKQRRALALEGGTK